MCLLLLKCMPHHLFLRYGQMRFASKVRGAKGKVQEEELYSCRAAGERGR
jgi:hypothetical protein